jgi:hypothetical protein
VLERARRRRRSVAFLDVGLDESLGIRDLLDVGLDESLGIRDLRWNDKDVGTYIDFSIATYGISSDGSESDSPQTPLP